MPSPIDLSRALLTRAAENFALDVELLRSPFLSRGERSRFLVAKYVALVTGRRAVPWFGRPLAYDNRWTPALLQGYPNEIAAILDATTLPAAPAVLDVGANVGQFAATLLGARPAARIWSCEPNPAPLALLRRNAATDARWTVVPYGVGPEDAELDFWFVADKSSQGSLHFANATLGLIGGTAERVQVPIRRLTPERLAEIEAPAVFDLVKIDVEGAERDALQGLADVTWRFLTIELSVGREGAMTKQELLDLCRSQWGPDVDVSGVLSDSSLVQELVLRNAAVAT